MPTCVEESPPETPVRYRPKLSELPALFYAHGGNLEAVADACGYKVLAVRRWIEKAGDQRELLEWHLKMARGKAKQARKDSPSAPAFLPPGELKHLVTVYYTTPWLTLEALDNDDLDVMSLRTACAPILSEAEALEAGGDVGQDALWVYRAEKSISVRTRPNPTTNETMHQRLSWADVRAVLKDLSDRETHVAMSWVGLGYQSPQSLRLLAEDPPQRAPKVRGDEIESFVRYLIAELTPKLGYKLRPEPPADWPERLNQAG